ncbi:alpha/beta hydrolase [Hugenholtzia roseola]|uniref:PGAP1-like alpha/beta domain-containing protein n=1 Tax=Hugenholtzia roseola TaxID=1002 RepID=UPI00041FEAAA|nr:alpha/beta hydrolase [Hugenholtzia roseola]
MPSDHKNPTPTITEDLRGAGQLSTEAVLGIVQIVEALHARISATALLQGNPRLQRTSGIARFVYWLIRRITLLVGAGVDKSLGRLGKILKKTSSSQAREVVVSALNGVLGDYLEGRKNPLAIMMQFRKNGISLKNLTLTEDLEKTKGRLMIMVHGLCMNDLQWLYKGQNHGEALAQKHNLTTLYLHYNTGRHISENGKSFAAALENLQKSYPQITEIYLLTHSMGGLVSRSALYYGNLVQHHWIGKVRKLFFLGTPHHGAPLERAGNQIDNILEIHPYSAPFARLGKIRSAGITDLRYGNIIDEDWQDGDKFDANLRRSKPIPLPTRLASYAIAGLVSQENQAHLLPEWVGDGLVPLGSALGKHQDEKWQLYFPAHRQYTLKGINHLQLLASQAVYQKLDEWLSHTDL